MNFNELYQEIVIQKENHNNNNFNCIPFTNFNRLEAIIPGIEKECYYILGSGTSVGKSSFIRDLFINNPINYIENNKHLDIKLDILYFSLEESKRKILTSELSKDLLYKYKISVSPNEIMSIGRKNTISKEVLEKIKDCEEHINKFNTYVTIYDEPTNGTGIYKRVRDFALKVGYYHYENGEPLNSSDMQSLLSSSDSTVHSKIRGYKMKHPNHYVIVIIDHLSLLQPSQNKTLREEMTDFSTRYALRMRDVFRFTPVVVQQFNLSKENVETNFQGKTIEEKLQPSIDSFGDAKTTVRESNVVLGLFNPNRYKINTFDGYDINILKDHFRTLHILKNRSGIANVKIPMFFTGKTGLFKELPKPDDQEIHKYYDYAKKLQQELVNKINN